MSTGRRARRLTRTAAGAAWQLSLLVSPRPSASILRRAFAANGAAIDAALARHVPAGIEEVLDEPYGDGPDERVDVYRPQSEEPLPAVVWVHGGGWIGGSKGELANWCRLIAGQGFAVVSVGYSLAPAHRYPTPVRQALAALAHLQANAARLGLDAERIVLAGDSAGAQIAAQVALVAADPGYADAVGLESTLAPGRLRGLVLACGPFDLSHASGATDARTRFMTTVLWAYSGRRRFADNPDLAAASVVDHLTGTFPPTFVTVGNADPLRVHSEALAERLAARGVEVDTLFWPAGHEPPLGHEYQFDLDSDAGRLAFERMLAFLRRR